MNSHVVVMGERFLRHIAIIVVDRQIAVCSARNEHERYLAVTEKSQLERKGLSGDTLPFEISSLSTAQDLASFGCKSTEYEQRTRRL